MRYQTTTRYRLLSALAWNRNERDEWLTGREKRMMITCRRWCGAITAVVVLLTMGAVDAHAAGIVPPRDPVANIAPSPSYNTTSGHSYVIGSPLPPCWRWHGGKFLANALSKQCVGAEVQASERAHRLEHVAAFTLPRNFSQLSANEQSLVLVDIERVSRGEPPVLGLSSAADAMAQTGARQNADPTLTNPHAIPGATGGWTSNWAAAVSPLDANYSWMYLDGWGGKGATLNFTCTTPTSPGCWGHRNDILVNSTQLPCYVARCALIMGAGYVPSNWAKTYNSYTELIIQVAATTPPPLIYTWRQALAAGARA